MAVCSEIN